MSKKELIDAMAERADIPKDKAAAALDAALAYIESTLASGGEVSIPPLGKFKTSERKARERAEAVRRMRKVQRKRMEREGY